MVASSFYHLMNVEKEGKQAKTTKGKGTTPASVLLDS